MSSLFSSPSKPDPVVAAPTPSSTSKKKSKKALLLASKNTGARGLLGEANTGSKQLI